MKGQRATLSRKPAQRRGSVLLIVLVVVAMLSLGAYTFSELMVAEVDATAMYGRGVQARALADSGVELAAAMLGDRSEITEENFYHDPEMFQGMLLTDATAARGRGRFSIVAPLENDSTAEGVRFGLMDESAKLNPAALLKLNLDDEEARNVLLALPEMTHEIADAILDWVDEDEIQREYGAEADYYLSLATPYEAKNGPLDSLDELLLVRGVTAWLLFGEDANRNGLLDPSENDGDLSPPADDADGVLQLGWSAYLTVYGRERNRRSDGSERIDLNGNLLTELYDSLEEEFGEDVAQFVTAYRIYGPVPDEDDESDSAGLKSETGGQSGKSPSGQDERGMRQLTQSIAKRLFGGGGGAVTRGGLDLSQGGSHKINSLYDLVDAQVEATVDKSSTLLESPWTSDPGDIEQYIPELVDKLSTTSNEFISGRIDVNQARKEVLLGLPDMTEALADAIVDSRRIGPDGEPLTETIASHATTGWLLMEGLVDLEQMRRLDKFLTTRGDVYRLQVVGYYDAGGPVSRLEAVIDATQQPPKIVFLRDLTGLGRGYFPRHLELPTNGL